MKCFHAIKDRNEDGTLMYCTLNYISISSTLLFKAGMQKFVPDSELAQGALKNIGSIVYELDMDKTEGGFFCVFIIRNMCSIPS